MNAKNLAIREKEMREIWDSFEPCFRSDLERLDYLSRAMVSEMRAYEMAIQELQKVVDDYGKGQP